MAVESSGKGGRRLARIGKYDVIAHIATGGMGAVYRAVDVDLGRPVALKVLPPEMAVKPAMLERFRREARSAAKLRHENIVAIYEFNESQGTYYLALEFVDGIDLHEYVSRRGKLKPDLARDIALQAARALDHAHAQGIVHRDIKPSNFLITQKEGRPLVKLTDMGLAREVSDEEHRVTRAGTTVGTVDYMSPEQARDSGAADTRSDIYSLGCTLFFMLSGICPFPEGSITERIYKHIETPPPDILEFNPETPPGLSFTLKKMLAKKPGDRYQTPQALIVDLEKTETPVELPDSAELAPLDNNPVEPPAPTIVSQRAKTPVMTPNREIIPLKPPSKPRLSTRPAAAPRKKKKKPQSAWLAWAAGTAGVAMLLAAAYLLFWPKLFPGDTPPDDPPGKNQQKKP